MSNKKLSNILTINDPVKFPAQVDFLTPMIFRISVAADPSSASASGIKQHRHPDIALANSEGIGRVRNAQAPLAKIDIRG